MNLNEKVIIVTGGAQGIGKGTAKACLEAGAKVMICDLNKNKLEETIEELKSLGEINGKVVDVTDSKAVEDFVQSTIKTFGRLDGVVNNAGITMDSTLLKMEEKAFDTVIDVNLKGVFNIGKSAAAVMTEGGSIINASSVVGVYGNFGQTNYAATKFGVIGMTKTWAKELGKKNIRVNAVAPGFIATPMTEKMPEKVLDYMKGKSPLKRLGQVEEVAKAYVYLLSDDAAFITGSVLNIDGGVVL